MSVTGFIVLLAVIWFITLWIVLPIGLRTQADDGERVDGTMSGSPKNFNPWRAFRLTTIYALLVWGVIVGLIMYTGLDVMSLDPLGMNARETSASE